MNGNRLTEAGGGAISRGTRALLFAVVVSGAAAARASGQTFTGSQATVVPGSLPGFAAPSAPELGAFGLGNSAVPGSLGLTLNQPLQRLAPVVQAMQFSASLVPALPVAPAVPRPVAVRTAESVDPAVLELAAPDRFDFRGFTPQFIAETHGRVGAFGYLEDRIGKRVAGAKIQQDAASGALRVWIGPVGRPLNASETRAVERNMTVKELQGLISAARAEERRRPDPRGRYAMLAAAAVRALNAPRDNGGGAPQTALRKIAAFQGSSTMETSARKIGISFAENYGAAEAQLLVLAYGLVPEFNDHFGRRGWYIRTGDVSQPGELPRKAVELAADMRVTQVLVHPSILKLIPAPEPLPEGADPVGKLDSEPPAQFANNEFRLYLRIERGIDLEGLFARHNLGVWQEWLENERDRMVTVEFRYRFESPEEVARRVWALAQEPWIVRIKLNPKIRQLAITAE